MSEKPITNSSIVRVAGNIASGLLMHDAEAYHENPKKLEIIAIVSVSLAKLIVAEVESSTHEG